MAAKDRSAEHCPSEALRLLGDYTTLRIIDFLSGSPLRFTDLRKALEDTSSPTLIARLKRMTQAGLLERSEATVDGKSVIYELTEDGRALIPVLREIQKFATRARPPKRQ